MTNFMNYITKIAYPAGAAKCHVSNPYFCSQFDSKPEFASAYTGFLYFHDNTFLDGSDYCT